MILHVRKGIPLRTPLFGGKNASEKIQNQFTNMSGKYRTFPDTFLGGKALNRTFYYARVSSCEQNLDRQLETFAKLGADEREIVTDKESGRSLDRPGYQALKTTMLRPGDTLVVKSLDRLSRNKADIKTELQFFKESGIRLKVIDLPTTMMELPTGQEWVFEMVNNILIEVLGTIAEQERETIRRRQREGINAAKSKGKHLGRPPAKRPENWDEVIASWRGGEITSNEARRRLKLRKTVFYKMLQESYDK